jgi:hypothetical protein
MSGLRIPSTKNEPSASKPGERAAAISASDPRRDRIDQSIVEMSDRKFYPTAAAMKDWYAHEYCPRVRHNEFGVRA